MMAYAPRDEQIARFADLLAALGTETRLRIVRLLLSAHPEGLVVGEIGAELAIPSSTLSHHLDKLKNESLVAVRRESTFLRYTANTEALQEILSFLFAECCTRSKAINPKTITCCQEHAMTDRAYNVLFLCTGNTARSVLAESILRRDGAGRFNAFSAGSQPKGVVNPFALTTLADCHYPIEGFRSKNWSEFAEPGAPKMDFVFTVCDSAAGEACPHWPGQPMTAHWGIEDPAAVEGTDLDKQRAFNAAFRYLRNRIGAFISLPLKSIDSLALGTKLREIGQMEGSTARPGRAS
jgi:ArsR family transcriptional regulator, arsenate/arsenite/antimonite-responsive transcriptional repressor / arsenate reductase (thioredoxin)